MCRVVRTNYKLFYYEWENSPLLTEQRVVGVGLRSDGVEKVEHVSFVENLQVLPRKIKLCLLLSPQEVLSVGIKGNITSSRPTTLHDAINMARELAEQAVQGRVARISESNKRKWEDQQKNNLNNNNPNNRNLQHNNQHHQQNRRQETTRAYVAAPVETRGYAGNLPM
ncbi:hypothetical protein Tco_0435943 [Tanacetum coccineum]